ncbi:MAG: FHA domain-containing protein [Isosphaeraceae bacterium]|nr:FHA domain-containing protein [Isosphaeraceae bacterium]
MRSENSEAPGSGLLVQDREEAQRGRPVERKIEDWVVCALEGKTKGGADSVWSDLLGPRAADALRPRSRPTEQPLAKAGDWARFRISERKGIAVLRLSDAMLLKDQVIQEFSEDLLELIRVGYDRIVLDFRAVERLSIQVVLGLVEAHRHCLGELGGMLKICGLRPEISEGLSLTGLTDALSLHEDEAEAIASPWPETGRLRPLPVNVLTFLKLVGDDVRTGESDQMTTTPSNSRRRERPGEAAPPVGVPGGGFEIVKPAVRLVIESGGDAGRTIELGRRRLLIGRDESCGLRIVAASVSRMHAAIDMIDDRVILRDLGSTNGTRLNDLEFQNESRELRDGDRIGIGPALLRVELSIAAAASHPDPTQPPPPGDARIVDWVRAEESEIELADDRAATEELEAHDPSESRLLRVERIQGVVVLTPIPSYLDEESRTAPLREELVRITRETSERRVVVDLRHVVHLSSNAIGILVAYAIELERLGGELRISQVVPRVMAVLHQIRLPMLIEVHPTTDEAVLCVWRSGRSKPGASA